ncbi:MAG: leucyl/phenylalanyl-tRNA--protein transferase [bacterium]|jgi:leucyl/phenylalanyl-tRNA--protein transferase
MTIYQLPQDHIFPNPELSEPNGLLAIGGDLSPERILVAYQNGIFPWFSPGEPFLWWSPDPRMVLFPEKFKISKSFRRVIKKEKFEIRIDTSFKEVMTQCAETPRHDQYGTWITDEMLAAYCQLHERGYAHSIESFYEDKLVGGLYGISIGNAFFGESMFAKMTDASKVAFAKLVELSTQWGFQFIDCQVTTTHLESLGAEEISRDKFLLLLEKSLQSPTRKAKWTI